jgi:hypothetical protein
LFHSSSASRVTAGAAGFLTFSQQSARPARYGEPALRHDALTAERAGVLVDDRALGLVMGIERDARLCATQQPRQGRFARFERLPAQILAVELEQVEGTKDYVITVPAPTQQVEHRQSVRIAHDCLAVDQAGPHWQLGNGSRGQGEAIGEVIALAGVQGHAAGVAFRQDAIVD